MFADDFTKHEFVQNQGQNESSVLFDERRAKAIEPIKQMIIDFLEDRLTLREFKEKSEKLSRTYPLWGFKGMSGQMQLNQFVNNIPDANKEKILKDVVRVPRTNEDAKQKINTLAQYIQKYKDAAENRRSIPRVSQISMLSYFWEMQDHKKWPVYYRSSEKGLTELGFFFEDAESPGDRYIAYVEAIDTVIAHLPGIGVDPGKYPHWYVEHILWLQFNKSSVEEEDGQEVHERKSEKISEVVSAESDMEWIPPIIADLELLSRNQETSWTKDKKIRPEKAFETKLRYAFTLLGFETSELGQGTGRQPDGIARSVNLEDGGDYAIIYDAKARESKYSLGTQDREIREYIHKKVRELRKDRIHRHYFCIVSSDFDESESMLAELREVYKQTRVPVVLLRAKDLMLIIAAKFQEIEIDHQLLENLFLETGLLTRERIVSELGI